MKISTCWNSVRSRTSRNRIATIATSVRSIRAIVFPKLNWCTALIPEIRRTKLQQVPMTSTD